MAVPRGCKARREPKRAARLVLLVTFAVFVNDIDRPNLAAAAQSVTGVLVGLTGNFGFAFALAAVVSILGFMGWVVGLPEVRPLH